jgi:hypothetical protein
VTGAVGTPCGKLFHAVVKDSCTFTTGVLGGAIIPEGGGVTGAVGTPCGKWYSANSPCY